MHFPHVWWFKGTRDFRTPHRPLIHGLKPFWIWLRICGVNRLWNCRFSSQRVHSGVIDTAVRPTLSKIFMNDPKRCFYAGIWFGCTRHMHSGVIDTAVTCTAESLTPLYKYDTAVTLDLFFEWLWLPIEKNIGKFTYTISITFTHKICHRCDENRRFHSQFSPRIQSHIQRGINSCSRSLGEVVWWKKTRGRKSLARVPLKRNVAVSIKWKLLSAIIWNFVQLNCTWQCKRI
jgi:hypothetical protein